MRMILCATVLAGAVAFVSSAASLPANGLTGTYIEARTADVYTGPCFANGEIEMNGREAVFAWKIANGNWEGVNLAGLGVVGVVHADHTLGNPYEPVNPAVAVLIVDSRADAAQRQALVQFAKSQAGDLLDHIVRIDYQPVELTIDNGNIHGGAATLTAGTLATIRTRALSSGDHICGNEGVFYPPLNRLVHSMPAYTLEDSYQGRGLGETWTSMYRRSAFLGTFQAAG
ncbi:MAG: DUF1326 domain-containing protein [Bryobacteraceae bacterium]